MSTLRVLTDPEKRLPLDVGPNICRLFFPLLPQFSFFLVSCFLQVSWALLPKAEGAEGGGLVEGRKSGGGGPPRVVPRRAVPRRAVLWRARMVWGEHAGRRENSSFECTKKLF